MKRFRCWAVLMLLCVLLTGCRGAEEAGEAHAENGYADAKIGIMTGSSHDGTVKNQFPEAQRVYFSSVADMVLALEQGKIDYYIEDECFFVPVIWEGANVKPLEEPVKQVSNGFIFPQSEDSRHLREQINEFIAESKADGTLDRLNEKWLGSTEPVEHPDYTALTGENGTLRLAAVVESKPMVYMFNEMCTGLEIEFLTLFGQRYGYAFEIETVPFNSVIAGISAGKYHMGSSGMNITPEREESVDFSDPYASYGVVLVEKKETAAGTASGLTLADFETATIGILSGSSFDPLAKERFPNATRQYYSMLTDMILAVQQGKIDGYLAEVPYVASAIWEGAKVEAVDEVVARTEAGYIFGKGENSAELRRQMDEFIIEAKAAGRLEELREKWMGAKEPDQFLDADDLTGEKGTIRVAVSPDLKPLAYIKDGKVTGFEIEILIEFAKAYGYKLDIHTMTFDAILPGVMANKYDIGAGGMTITPERAKSVDFSESYQTVDVVMVTAAREHSFQTDLWEDIKDGFEKTFIRESRWKMILKGMGVTMLISLCAAAGGTALGFGLYMLSRSEMSWLSKLTRGVAKVYTRIIAGTPVVVVLMILFYVVFGKFKDLSGVLVAIIGFILTFGSFVYSHMGVAVSSVDRGQLEAAYSLGYTRNKTFFRIILPQAMTIFLPTYCGQAVELVKATAVVGYIAVNDLTKMGDIIRSNTYEAFFPLISTAVIYFLLTWLLALLLGRVKAHFEPKRRSPEEILKGVKTV